MVKDLRDLDLKKILEIVKIFDPSSVKKDSELMQNIANCSNIVEKNKNGVHSTLYYKFVDENDGSRLKALNVKERIFLTIVRNEENKVQIEYEVANKKQFGLILSPTECVTFSLSQFPVTQFYKIQDLVRGNSTENAKQCIKFAKFLFKNLECFDEILTREIEKGIVAYKEDLEKNIRILNSQKTEINEQIRKNRQKINNLENSAKEVENFIIK